MEYTYEPELLSVGTLATVDSAPDNGFSNCAAGAYSSSLRHDSTAAAINNLVGGLPLTSTASGSKNPVIVGHGNEGLLITGEGQNASDSRKFLMTWNEVDWGSELQRLQSKSYPILTIVSCHTGAGDAGADLLFAIAKRINRAVQARTGFAYCGDNKITYENNSTWQVATPTNRPNPIGAPTPHFVTNLQNISFQEEGNLINLDVSSPIEVTFSRPSRSGLPLFAKGEQLFAVQGDTAKGLLAQVDFGNPFQPGGVPAAVITGILSLKGKDTSGKDILRDFAVYNDRLLQDVQELDTFYSVASGFRLTVQQLSR